MGIVRAAPVALLLVLFSTDALADGLYVGHGRRSVDDAWSVRFNVSGGLTNAADPWEGGFSDRRIPLGGYLHGGVEFDVGHDNSLELYGAYRNVDDDEDFLEFDEPGGRSVAGRYQYELTTASGGLTLRHRYPGRGGASYWGLGGGVISAEVDYQERIGQLVGTPLSVDETGMEAHALVGWDGRLAPGLTLGLELGFRYAWVDFDDLFVDGQEISGDPTGFFGGLRLGVLLGR